MGKEEDNADMQGWMEEQEEREAAAAHREKQDQIRLAEQRMKDGK